MNHSLEDTNISVTDPNHAGLPLALAFSEHPGAGGFGVDAVHDRVHPLRACISGLTSRRCGRGSVVVCRIYSRLNSLKIELQFCQEAKLFGNTIFIGKADKFGKNRKQINTWRWMACSTILYTAVMNVC